ncbi:MAG: hypothetical protein IJW62_05730 [Clostridia bacterium]|nr:hypothetical protein [Clostridia bacterium]
MKNAANQTKTKKTQSRKIPWKALLPWIIVASVIAAILAGAGIYTAVTEEDPQANLPYFTYDSSNGSYTDGENGITYYPAPFCFEAVLNAAEDSPYAKSDRWSLYQIGYRDGEGKAHLRHGSEWLTTPRSVGGQIYYNPKAVTVPAYADFDWGVIYFSNVGSASFSTYKMNEEDTDQLMKEILAEENPNLYESRGTDGLDPKLTLRVTSDTYYWLYLNLTVYQDEEGNYFISPEGVKILDDPFLVQVDSTYFDDYLKTMEDIINSTS